MKVLKDRSKVDYGAIIREARTRCGLTQEELARRMATGQSIVARLESKTSLPSLRTMERVAKELDCELVVRLQPKDEVA